MRYKLADGENLEIEKSDGTTVPLATTETVSGAIEEIKSGESEISQLTFSAGTSGKKYTLKVIIDEDTDEPTIKLEERTDASA